MLRFLGFLFVGLAAIGLALPGLPTTPFLLLAASCFSKSSERWHQWLLNNRTFGGMVRNWEENRCIARRSKTVAIVMVLLFGGFSVGFALNALWLRIVVGLTLIYALYFVSGIPICDSSASSVSGNQSTEK